MPLGQGQHGLRAGPKFGPNVSKHGSVHHEASRLFCTHPRPPPGTPATEMSTPGRPRSWVREVAATKASYLGFVQMANQKRPSHVDRERVDGRVPGPDVALSEVGVPSLPVPGSPPGLLWWAGWTAGLCQTGLDSAGIRLSSNAFLPSLGTFDARSRNAWHRPLTTAPAAATHRSCSTPAPGYLATALFLCRRGSATN